MGENKLTEKQARDLGLIPEVDSKQLAELRDLRLRAEGLSKKRDDALRREGYMLALRRVRRFGQDKKGDAALTDEERYILDGAAEILEGEAPGEPTP